MEVEKALKRLLIKEPFYGLFCLGLEKIITREIPTLCVRKAGVSVSLCINPDFWNQHTDAEQIALLLHELGHITMHHIFMSKDFPNKKLFNIAADLEVNSYIKDLPEGALHAKAFGLENSQGTKFYYEFFQKSASKLGTGTGDNGSNNSDSDNNSSTGPGSDGNTLDDHSTWKEFEQCSDSAKELLKSTIDGMLVHTAEQVERQKGSIPGHLKEHIDKLRAKRPEVFNWRAYFRRMLGSIYDINVRSSRRKLSKRFEGSAGLQHKKKVSILVAVDTSGSVCTKELADFFVEIEYIFKAGARVTVIQCDTDINSVDEYDGKTIPEIKGRGGTEFDPVIDYYLQHKREYASLIYFTDGYCGLPKISLQDMIWVITPDGNHQDYPGKVVYIPKLSEE